MRPPNGGKTLCEHSQRPSKCLRLVFLATTQSPSLAGSLPAMSRTTGTQHPSSSPPRAASPDSRSAPTRVPRAARWGRGRTPRCGPTGLSPPGGVEAAREASEQPRTPRGNPGPGGGAGEPRGAPAAPAPTCPGGAPSRPGRGAGLGVAALPRCRPGAAPPSRAALRLLPAVPGSLSLGLHYRVRRGGSGEAAPASLRHRHRHPSSASSSCRVRPLPPPSSLPPRCQFLYN